MKKSSARWASVLMPILLTLSFGAAALEIGDKAPDFSLLSTQGGRFRLSDQAGKKNVIIQFYVLDFTPT